MGITSFLKSKNSNTYLNFRKTALLVSLKDTEIPYDKKSTVKKNNLIQIP